MLNFKTFPIALCRIFMFLLLFSQGFSRSSGKGYVRVVTISGRFFFAE